jgi:hypothetical protein
VPTLVRSKEAKAALMLATENPLICALKLSFAFEAMSAEISVHDSVGSRMLLNESLQLDEVACALISVTYFASKAKQSEFVDKLFGSALLGQACMQVAVLLKRRQFIGHHNVQLFVDRLWQARGHEPSYAKSGPALVKQALSRHLLIFVAYLLTAMPPLRLLVQLGFQLLRNRSADSVLREIVPPRTRFYLDKIIFFALLILFCDLQPLIIWCDDFKARTNAVNLTMANVRCAEAYTWTDPNDQPVLEAVLIVWLLSHVVSALQDLHRRRTHAQRMNLPNQRSYLDIWDLVDLCALLGGLLGFALRYAQRAQPGALGLDGNEGLSWAIMFLWLRLLPVVTSHPKIGPLLQMVIQILTQDMIYFLVLLSLFVMAFITCMRFLFGGGGSRVNSGSDSEFDAKFDTLYGSARAVIRVVLQDPFFEAESLRHPFIGWFMMVLLTVLTTIMMINLLVAMMSQTFTNVYAKPSACRPAPVVAHAPVAWVLRS